MIRKNKLYVKPRKAYEKARIEEENILIKKYGLKNKREIWKTLAKVTYFRHQAKALARKSNEEQEVFLGKLRELGLNTQILADVLALKVENLLNRRLQTIIVTKQFAQTPKQARQLVAHKKVLVDGKAINKPSYIVPVKFESTIKVKSPPVRQPAVESPKEETQELQSEEVKEETA